jgi:competence protein ComEC
MKRPLFLFAISIIAGIVSGQVSRSYLFVILTVILIILGVFLINIKFKGLLYIFIGIIIFYSVGAIEYLYTDNSNTDKFIDFAEKEIVIKGVVNSEPDIRESKVIYVIETSEIKSGKSIYKMKGKILLTTLKDDLGQVFGYGNNIEINGQLSIPKGRRNPGGFDYKNFLAKSGISATIFASKDNIKVYEGIKQNVFINVGSNIRNGIINVINKSLPTDQAGLLNGMLIGYKAGLSKEVQGNFSDSGLSHIMAVSGMNVAFIVMPLVFLFKKFYIKQKIANSIIIVLLILFVFIAGFSPSVVRAVIMGIVILIGQMIRRESDVITSMSLAAIILLIYNPYTFFDIGFQLSFAATFSLVLFYKNIKGMLNFKYIPGFLADLLAVTLAAQIGVYPLIIYYFNKISVISVISNIIVVPMVEAITIIGFIMAAVGQVNIVFSQLIGYINCSFLTFILFISKNIINLPFAVIKVTTPSGGLVFSYYIVVLYFLWLKPKYKLKVRKKYYAAVLFVIAVIIIIRIATPKSLEVVFIDVGQGDSELIRTASGKTVLIDGGGYNSTTNPDSNIGDTTIIPFLLDYGVSKLDIVIATHGHEDHIQGLRPVLQSFNVGRLVLPDWPDETEFNSLLDITKARRIPLSKCEAGDNIKLDDKTSLKVLYPVKGTEEVISDLNEHSLVAKLIYKKISVLFTGDLDESVENVLIKGKADIKADVLKVPHHGSVYSTHQSFLDVVRPSAAVISVGKNTFGHPSPVVLDRLKSFGVKVFRTDQSGAIILRSDGNKIKISTTVQ